MIIIIESFICFGKLLVPKQKHYVFVTSIGNEKVEGEDIILESIDENY